ncbi:OapC/ArvC family zinc-ribbon domain-containing protein [Halomontanus rarus]|uniref:OapC/ArvC family zinc-ribbon domain-containing protein n=1 Tax=Halomontanus rarus TaxID=3034020 RepID=UPI0023E88623|nr:Zn-ribbon containing protein [Halovivax sp. TS33]
MPHQCTNCDRTFPDGSKEMLSGCPDCGGNKFQFAPASAMSEAGGREAESSGRERQSIMAEESDDENDGTVSRATETVRDWVSSSGSKSKTDTDTNSPDTNRYRSWPDGDGPVSSSSAEAGDADDSTTFEEWPDTARPPADRSGSESEPSREETPPQPSSSDATAEGGSERASPSRRSATIEDDEDTAQADARSAVVSPDDLPPSVSESSDTGSEGGTESVPDTEPTTDTTPPDHGRVVSEPSGDRPSLDELREELNDQFESIKIVNPGQYELNLMELYDREEYIVSLQEDGRYVIDVPDSWRDSDD